jgi:hypothetical protein
MTHPRTALTPALSQCEEAGEGGFVSARGSK